MDVDDYLHGWLPGASQVLEVRAKEAAVISIWNQINPQHQAARRITLYGHIFVGAQFGATWEKVLRRWSIGERSSLLSGPNSSFSAEQGHRPGQNVQPHSPDCCQTLISRARALPNSLFLCCGAFCHFGRVFLGFFLVCLKGRLLCFQLQSSNMSGSPECGSVKCNKLGCVCHRVHVCSSP